MAIKLHCRITGLKEICMSLLLGALLCINPAQAVGGGKKGKEREISPHVVRSSPSSGSRQTESSLIPLAPSWWTHTPRNGTTLYVDNAEISFSTNTGRRFVFPVEDEKTGSLLKGLNKSLYFGGYGGAANHCFLSLRIGYGSSSLEWSSFILAWTPKRGFYFTPSNQKGPFADFYNVVGSQWRNQKPIDKAHPVKFVAHHHEDVEGVTGCNHTHSEPGIIGLLMEDLGLLTKAIQRLPEGSCVRVMQLCFHSFLDFCTQCEEMVGAFIQDIKQCFTAYWSRNPAQGYTLGVEGDQLDYLFLVTGMNNRLYRHKNYFGCDDRGHEEKLRFSQYYLRDYRPLVGRIACNADGDSSKRLLTIIKTPVAHSDLMQYLPYNIRVSVSLQQRAAWTLGAQGLYNDVGEYVKALSPVVTVADLSYARLGIDDGEDYWDDGYTLSQGGEIAKLSKGFRKTPNLHTLILDHNCVHAEQDLTALTNILPSLQNLTCLSLSDALCVTWYKSDLVSSLLAGLTNLEHLDLSRNSINVDQFNKLKPGLYSLSNLRTLNLSGNRLSSEYDFHSSYKGDAEEDTYEILVELCVHLNESPRLQRLNLTKNGFDDFSFCWVDVREQSALSKADMVDVYDRLIIEVDAGGVAPYLDEDDELLSSEEDSSSW